MNCEPIKIHLRLFPNLYKEIHVLNFCLLYKIAQKILIINFNFSLFQALAQIWGCSFVEASAKHRTNVNEVFAEIVREMNLKHSTKDREIVCECCVIS